ncbi:MAG: 1-acyl-sn-glycerol-3-phosphate acyltransferase [Bacteroidota bacterium]
MDKIPADKPVILACNHPTAFTEPAYIGGATLKARNFMLRGDMFSGGPITAAFLKSIKCIPIYRAQDGMANLKKNEAILEYCYDLLGKGENLFILSEGESKLEKRLRTIQKGTARMAFGAYEKHGRKDIVVVPIGINYMDANRFRSKIYADFGPPIPIADYLEAHAKNPRRAVKLLTDKLKLELRKRVIHVAKEEDDVLANKLLTIMENNKVCRPFPLISTKPSRQFEFIALIDRFNALDGTQKLELSSRVDAYYKKLDQYGLEDMGVAQTRYYSWPTFFALFVGFIPFLIGTITNFIPTQIPKTFADKKIKQPKFYASVQIGMGAVLYFVYFITLLTIAAIWGNIWWILAVCSMPFFGIFSALWWEYANKWNDARKVQALDQGIVEQIRAMRKNVNYQAMAFLKKEPA